MAMYMSVIKNRARSILPRVKELAFTSRSKVEVLKANCIAIEKEFQKTRDELKRCDEHLDAIKRDLQTLYTLRANEYLKPRQEQSIKEINERENQLNELEREATMAVASVRQREEEQLISLQSSNELLYQTSLTYANRFIIMGLGIGSAMMAWRGYRWTRDTVKGGGASSNEVGVSDTNVVTLTTIEYGKLEESLSSMNGLLKDLARAKADVTVVKKERLTANESTTGNTQEVIDGLSAKMDKCLALSHSNSQVTPGPIFLLGAIGGIVGATVAMVFSQR